jgi:hypothetical protein
MTAEILYLDSDENGPDFTIQIEAETVEERFILQSLEGQPFTSVVVEGTNGSMLRVFNLRLAA